MRIALVGWGTETKSAFNYYGSKNSYLIVNEEPRDDFPQSENVSVRTNENHRPVGLSGNSTDLSYLKDLEDYDLIIYSPSSRKNLETVYADSSVFWYKAKTTLHLFFEKCPSKNIIGITGTKGKGTTTTLISEMIKAGGITAHIGGNIGIPVLNLLQDIKTEDYVVLELSSFQLYKFPYSPHIAVHLMMIPEHIAEWHKTMDDYVEAKRQIFASQTEKDIAIYNPKNEFSSENVKFSRGNRIPYLVSPGAFVENEKIYIDNREIIDVSKIGLIGKHNLENICASLTASWQIHQNIDAYKKVIPTFKGLEHRLQHVREIDGVKFYDDSFGTTPDTAVVAMDTFIEPKVVIVGGHDKGNEFTAMIDRLMKEDIRGLVCIGPTGKFISEALINNGFDKDKIITKEDVNNWNMLEIVKYAKNMARNGDTVLLSTGSASFGIFKDYKDRGNQFIQSVNKL
jgi:UDP-N-acetylmuramoylalanine--D-glutamate ligase